MGWIAWLIIGIVAGVLLAGLITSKSVIEWLTTRYRVTTHRLVVRTGLFTTTRREIPIDAINSVGVRQNAIERLLGKVPIFGICLGHQLLTLALGGRTYKLKFGHRGVNQPVRNEATGKVEITSQNHGFAADEGSLTAVGAKITHISLNDMTVEGFSHPDKAIFSVQYHPEASAGPHDASYLFDCFRSMMETGCAPSAQDMHEAQLRLAGVHEQ